MTFYDARFETPPSGGIFLSENLIVPPLVVELITALPKLQTESEAAQRELDEIFRDDTTRLPTELSPYMVYMRQLSDLIHAAGKKAEVNIDLLERVTRVESLKEQANRFQDARSVISRFGTATVDTLQALGPGLHAIGEHYYEILEIEVQGSWFCGLDDENGQTVHYNRCPKEGETNARTASLSDFVQLIADVTLSRAAMIEQDDQAQALIAVAV